VNYPIAWGNGGIHKKERKEKRKEELLGSMTKKIGRKRRERTEVNG